MQEIVTIIIPNYNKGEYLENCINSVINQIFRDWHLIIIDDASNDNSRNILKKFSHNPKITTFYLNKNKGPSFCRNLGLRKSFGKYIAFLNSDDLWHENKLYEQINYMENKKLCMTFTDYFSIKDETEKKILKKTNIVGNFNYNKFLKDNSINTSTLVIRKDTIGLIKFKKINLLEDYLFKCDILRTGISAYKLDKVLSTYIITKKNRSSKILKNVYYLILINKKFNNLSFFLNIYYVLRTCLKSIAKYGFKKYF